MRSLALPEGDILVQSHIGQIIFSTTLDTEEKVKRYYGGESWSKIEGKFLLGASSDYAVNSTGGETTHQHMLHGTGWAAIGNHSNTTAFQNISGRHISLVSGDKYAWQHNSDALFTSSDLKYDLIQCVNLIGATNNKDTLPPYKAVYIWERTA